ncbi:unnamed protein product [Notodromas monacha]|uniref:Uncharacterized protein n=1 Tax=Notodromas monacha TaxID=399045 RepID=A0A7R9BSL5_9CRUS|nr:unnamed protein product [Notodromas monacha]CAG0920647.1 unnamed protein product [Notodromas monacha]
MTLHMAKCIRDLYCQEHAEIKNCQQDVQIFATDIWKSLNYRPVQRMYNPSIDLNHEGKQSWDPFMESLQLLLPVISHHHRFQHSPSLSSTEFMLFGDFKDMESTYLLHTSIQSAKLTIIQGHIKAQRVNRKGSTEFNLQIGTNHTTMHMGQQTFIQVTSPTAIFGITTYKSPPPEQTDSQDQVSGWAKLWENYLSAMDLLARAVDHIFYGLNFEGDIEKIRKIVFKRHFFELH